MLFCLPDNQRSGCGGGFGTRCIRRFLEIRFVRLSNEKTIRTFLYTSVRNGCLNYLRDLEIRARNDRKAVPESEEDQDCFLLRQMESEVVTELFEAIDELPERCREIFYMAYLQEKEEKQIAELLRVSVNTVKTQKQRAKAYLKGRLGELFVYMTLFFFEF